MTRVMLTGLGLVTAHGLGVEPFWRAMLENRTAFTTLPGRPASARIPTDVCSAPVGHRKAQLTDTVIVQALADAELPRLPDDAAVVVTAQSPRVGTADPDGREFEGPAPETLDRFGGTAAVHLSHACASALFALAWARDLLLAGECDVALVAGVNTANRYELASMDVVKALSPTVARPFDVARDGITLGEGGGAVVLETERHARARGARCDIAVSGAVGLVSEPGAAASDPGAIRDCVSEVLREAALAKVDYIHAHATGTPQGDGAEAEALTGIAAEAGWPAPVPAGSHKGSVGHLLHASAFPALATAVRVLRTGTAPPTPGLRNPPATGALDLLLAPRSLGPARHALVTSFGFNGNNASAILSRVPAQNGEC